MTKMVLQCWSHGVLMLKFPYFIIFVFCIFCHDVFLHIFSRIRKICLCSKFGWTWWFYFYSLIIDFKFITLALSVQFFPVRLNVEDICKNMFEIIMYYRQTNHLIKTMILEILGAMVNNFG
jgi:hypothetical protein